jgi:hypothetical protein
MTSPFSPPKELRCRRGPAMRQWIRGLFAGAGGNKTTWAGLFGCALLLGSSAAIINGGAALQATGVWGWYNNQNTSRIHPASCTSIDSPRRDLACPLVSAQVIHILADLPGPRPDVLISGGPSRGLTSWLRGLRDGCSVRTTSPTTKVTPAACHC